jgi:hypothetical protein
MNPNVARWTRIVIALYLAAVIALCILSFSDEAWLTPLLWLTLPGSTLSGLWTWSAIHGGGEAPYALVALLSGIANAFAARGIVRALGHLLSRPKS